MKTSAIRQCQHFPLHHPVLATTVSLIFWKRILRALPHSKFALLRKWTFKWKSDYIFSIYTLQRPLPLRRKSNISLLGRKALTDLSVPCQSLWPHPSSATYHPSATLGILLFFKHAKLSLISGPLPLLLPCLQHISYQGFVPLSQSPYSSLYMHVTSS